MHMPTTIIESSEVIGIYCNRPLHRWTEENGTRVFEERVISAVTESGTAWRGIRVFETKGASS